ncbi:MAG: hypothetical protein N838_03960 [Thiohalocapsa sp. PB-PSB1]|jgi:hypothetical protein|nr:MAG: hypothetical protein N838_03960 [Thiohalocapsa sp. PB-PSB1]
MLSLAFLHKHLVGLGGQNGKRGRGRPLEIQAIFVDLADSRACLDARLSVIR